MERAGRRYDAFGPRTPIARCTSTCGTAKAGWFASGTRMAFLDSRVSVAGCTPWRTVWRPRRGRRAARGTSGVCCCRYGVRTFATGQTGYSENLLARIRSGPPAFCICRWPLRGAAYPDCRTPSIAGLLRNVVSRIPASGSCWKATRRARATDYGFLGGAVYGGAPSGCGAATLIAGFPGGEVALTSCRMGADVHAMKLRSKRQCVPDVLGVRGGALSISGTTHHVGALIVGSFSAVNMVKLSAD